MYEGYEIILSDSESLHLNWREEKVLPKLIKNFAECLGPDGRWKIAGTHYFWVDTIKSGTVEQTSEYETDYYFDGLYRMRAYGGYEWGGRGCFYEEVSQ